MTSIKRIITAESEHEMAFEANTVLRTLVRGFDRREGESAVGRDYAAEAREYAVSVVAVCAAMKMWRDLHLNAAEPEFDYDEPVDVLGDGASQPRRAKYRRAHVFPGRSVVERNGVEIVVDSARLQKVQS